MTMDDVDRVARPLASDVANIRWLVDGNPAVARAMAEVVARQQQSLAWHRRARRAAAGLPSQLAYESPTLPLCIAHGSGSRLRDVDGHEYVDFHLAYTAGLLGHRPEPVMRAVHEAVERGCPAGVLVPEQVELAELVRQVTGTERVAVLHTGGQAVEAAVRIARAATGRRLVAKFAGCYHGANEVGLHNSFATLSGGPPSSGEPEPTAASAGVLPSRDLLILRFGDPGAISALERRAGDLAAVVVDPCPPSMRDFPDLAREFVVDLVEAARRSGVLVVLDEVVTGFRLARGGAAQAYGVDPDLVCFAKVSSGLGLPVSLLAGRAALLDLATTDRAFPDAQQSKVWLSSTHAANPIAVVAALAQLRYVVDQHAQIAQTLDHLGGRLAAEVAAVAQGSGVAVRTSGNPRLHYALALGDPAPDGQLQQDDRAVERMRSLARMTFYLRLQGMHMKVAPTLHLSAAHDESDVAAFARALQNAVDRMVEDGALSRE
jgi:glutamate-1-semialdehyde 2,1-aminomutase